MSTGTWRPPDLREINPGGIVEFASAYHGVRAVKGAAAGFRGINGRRPAKTRVPSIYSTTLASPWTAVRAVTGGSRAIPPQNHRGHGHGSR